MSSLSTTNEQQPIANQAKVIHATALPVTAVGTRRRAVAARGDGSEVCLGATETTTASQHQERQQGEGRGQWLDVKYRPIRDSKDLPQLKMLHDASFPLEYEPRYYEWLLSVHCCCLLATVSRTPSGSTIPQYGPDSISTCNLTRPPPEALLPEPRQPKEDGRRTGEGGGRGGETEATTPEGVPTNDASVVAAASAVVPPQDGPDRLFDERIVGFIVGRVKHVQTSDVVPWSSIIFNTQSHLEPVGYIATFGVVPDYRGSDISNELLQRLLGRFASVGKMVTSGGWIKPLVKKFTPSIKDVYLHVLGTNHAAMRFYARKGFVSVDKVEGYYAIYGQNHPAIILQFPGLQVEERRGEGRGCSTTTAAGTTSTTNKGGVVFASSGPPPMIDLKTTEPPPSSSKFSSFQLLGAPRRPPGEFLEDNDDLEEQLEESHKNNNNINASTTSSGGEETPNTRLAHPHRLMTLAEKIFHASRFLLVLLALVGAAGALIHNTLSSAATVTTTL